MAYTIHVPDNARSISAGRRMYQRQIDKLPDANGIAASMAEVYRHPMIIRRDGVQIGVVGLQWDRIDSPF